MPSRSLRLAGHVVRVTLFVLVGIMAVRFFTDALSSDGWAPRTFFALLLLTGAVSLVWRSALDLVKVARRRRGRTRRRA